MAQQATVSSLARFQTVDEASRALALVPARRTDLAVSAFYDMAPLAARELMARQPTALAANMVSRDSASEGSHLLTLMAPEQAAKTVVAAVVMNDGKKPLEFKPLDGNEAARLVRSRRVVKRDGAFWWTQPLTTVVSEDAAFHFVRLILDADAEVAWKAELLNLLGASFIALAKLSTASDGDVAITDRVYAIDQQLAEMTDQALDRESYVELADDIADAWEAMVEAGDFVEAHHQDPDSVRVSEMTIGELVDGIK